MSERQAPPADHERHAAMQDQEGADTGGSDYQQAPPADLREQAPIENVITTAMLGDKPTVDDMPDFIDTANRVTVAVLAVFAERERLLRERIEALPCADAPGRQLLYRGDVVGVFDDHPPGQ